MQKLYRCDWGKELNRTCVPIDDSPYYVFVALCTVFLKHANERWPIVYNMLARQLSEQTLFISDWIVVSFSALQT